ncbi:uncharacterized protein C8A04DRAFT_12071 [Dichotomopilus funicola]|uniref:Uncharacterized protein n=1 Tax=Dichotomopilus funicola TaxID=1934379 RepID=A0AAN6V472_9PEZI|nr:hypothetical protein C8A04DRAFT_12071 [Dichotomopilus funicola]
MSFGDGIKALLDTYANCISLLKAFGHSREEDGAPDAQHRRSRLRRSLRSDRSLVERAYSSRLSESGSRFRKGDVRAVTALDRVLKKLKSAIRNLLRLSNKNEGLDLDYQSLLSLSNGSRAEAIKAIDSLSRRIGSSSRSSVVSSSHSKAPSKHRRKSSPDPRHSTTKSSKGTGHEHRASQPMTTPASPPLPPPKSPEIKPALKKPRRASQPATAPPPPPPKEPEIGLPTPTPRIRNLNPETNKGGPSKDLKVVENNRISIISFASDSTKLGEIPQRKWEPMARHLEVEPDGDEYNVRPMFPLKPYTVEVKEKRFLGLFRRKRDS